MSILLRKNQHQEQGEPSPIPDWLTINWWWLAYASCAEAVLWSTFHLPNWGLVVSVVGLLQCLWLKGAEPQSRAIYWFLGALAVAAISIVPKANVAARHPHIAIVFGAVFGLVELGIWLAYVFVFRAEMQRHFNETDPVQLTLSPWMTFFFSSLYFQYHFRDIAEYKKRGQGITPEPA